MIFFIKIFKKEDFVLCRIYLLAYCNFNFFRYLIWYNHDITKTFYATILLHDIDALFLPI